MLYPTGNLQPGWTGVPLRREPAITGLDWSFAPIPRSEKRIARQNSCRPPPEFPPASPCPGIDRPASGLTPVTSGLFRPCSWSRKRLRAYWFPCAFGVWKLLKLATKINSPVRVSRRKVQPRSSPLVLTGHPVFLRGDSSLSGRTLYLLIGFRYFSPPCRGTFQHSLTLLVRYRSRVVFRVSSQCLPSWRRISDLRYSGVALVLVGYTYGTITLFGSPFQTNSA